MIFRRLAKISIKSFSIGIIKAYIKEILVKSLCRKIRTFKLLVGIIVKIFSNYAYKDYFVFVG